MKLPLLEVPKENGGHPGSYQTWPLANSQFQCFRLDLPVPWQPWLAVCACSLRLLRGATWKVLPCTRPLQCRDCRQLGRGPRKGRTFLAIPMEMRVRHFVLPLGLQFPLKHLCTYAAATGQGGAPQLPRVQLLLGESEPSAFYCSVPAAAAGCGCGALHNTTCNRTGCKGWARC